MSKNLSVGSSKPADKIWFLLVLVLGSISWSLTMVKSGLIGAYGMGFWGANGHDGVWHIALANQLAKGNYVMPTFAGAALQNYHLGFDLVLAFAHKVTGLGFATLYFQVLPPILALLIGVLTYKFVYLWRGSKTAANWALFFVYFGGSFGWLVSLFRGEGLGGESMFWAQQSISTLINPPFALSLVFLLSGLIFLLKYLEKKSTPSYLFCVVVFGLLVQVKIYAGLLVLGGLMIAGIYHNWRAKSANLLTVFAGTALLSGLLFLLSVKSAGGLIVYQPFWFLETMMGLSDRLDWPRFFSAMTNYKASGNLIKAIPAYLLAFLIFWYGNMGTRFLGEFALFRQLEKRKIDSLWILIYSIIIAGGIISLIFLQKGTPWNTIQFFYYSLFFSALLAGIGVAELFKMSKGVRAYSTIALVVILTIPTTIATLNDVYLPSRPPAKLAQEELEALAFLATQPDGVVLTYPFDKAAADAAILNPPRPLYLYESTAYVSAFSGKQTFLEDEVNLNITNYQWEQRRQETDAFYQTLDQEAARSFLRDGNIRYVYWLDGQRGQLGESQLGLETIFENQFARVLVVR